MIQFLWLEKSTILLIFSALISVVLRTVFSIFFQREIRKKKSSQQISDEKNWTYCNTKMHRTNGCILRVALILLHYNGRYSVNGIVIRTVCDMAFKSRFYFNFSFSHFGFESRIEILPENSPYSFVLASKSVFVFI